MFSPWDIKLSNLLMSDTVPQVFNLTPQLERSKAEALSILPMRASCLWVMQSFMERADEEFVRIGLKKWRKNSA